MILDKCKQAIITVVFLSLTPVLINSSCAATISRLPILDTLVQQGKPLTKDTTKWMQAWRGANLDSSEFIFPDLSGASSIHLQIERLDQSDNKGYKKYGFFMSHNRSGNPDTEIAYFNLAAILGYDAIIRPTIAHTLSLKGMQRFKYLLEHTAIKEAIRLNNKTATLKAIATKRPLKGCLKADKPKTYIDYEAIANTKVSPTGAPQTHNAVISALQATNHQPVANQLIKLKNDYKGDIAQLAREYSIIMTLDAVFQQWDRYTGNNIGLIKDKAGNAHFYASDNGGAGLLQNPAWVTHNLNWFSRYDRTTINQLKTLYAFLLNPKKGYLGYTNAQRFVSDLGLYGELSPAIYVTLLRRNLQLLLTHVATVERKYGRTAVYL